MPHKCCIWMGSLEGCGALTVPNLLNDGPHRFQKFTNCIPMLILHLLRMPQSGSEIVISPACTCAPKRGEICSNPWTASLAEHHRTTHDACHMLWVPIRCMHKRAEPLEPLENSSDRCFGADLPGTDQSSWTRTTGHPGYISLGVGKLELRLCRPQWLLQPLLLPSLLLLVGCQSPTWSSQLVSFYLHDVSCQTAAASAGLDITWYIQPLLQPQQLHTGMRQ